MRKRGEQTGLDTLVVHALNDGMLVVGVLATSVDAGNAFKPFPLGSTGRQGFKLQRELGTGGEPRNQRLGWKALVGFNFPERNYGGKETLYPWVLWTLLPRKFLTKKNGWEVALSGGSLGIYQGLALGTGAWSGPRASGRFGGRMVGGYRFPGKSGGRQTLRWN